MKYCKFILSAMGCLLAIYLYGQNNVSGTQAKEQRRLKDVYKDAFLLGAAVTPAITSGADKTIQEIVVSQFNSITAENVMKAALINPSPGVYDFGPADDFVAFGKKHNMFIVGHTLVWHNQCPEWFFTNADGKPNNKEEQIERLRKHIEVVAGRYAGQGAGMGCCERSDR